jgi:hypothetical protein
MGGWRCKANLDRGEQRERNSSSGGLAEIFLVHRVEANSLEGEGNIELGKSYGRCKVRATRIKCARQVREYVPKVEQLVYVLFFLTNASVVV